MRHLNHLAILAAVLVLPIGAAVLFHQSSHRGMVISEVRAVQPPREANRIQLTQPSPVPLPAATAAPVEAPRKAVAPPVVLKPVPVVRPVVHAPVAARPAPVPAGGVQGMIVAGAAHWGASAAQLLRVARCESGFNPMAHNPSGASGLFQFMPATWAANSVRAGHAGASIWDPAAQADTAAWMFARGQQGQWVCK